MGNRRISRLSELGGDISEFGQSLWRLICKISGASFAVTGVALIVIAIPYVQLTTVEPPQGVTYQYHQANLTSRFFGGGLLFLLASAFTTHSSRDYLIECWDQITPSEPAVWNTESSQTVFFISPRRVPPAGFVIALFGWAIVNGIALI